MTKRNPDLKIGDDVMYAREWLRNTGQFSGAVPFRCGKIKALQYLGDRILAYVHWDDGVTGNVLTVNLVRRDRRHLEPV